MISLSTHLATLTGTLLVLLMWLRLSLYTLFVCTFYVIVSFMYLPHTPSHAHTHTHTHMLYHTKCDMWFLFEFVEHCLEASSWCFVMTDLLNNCLAVLSWFQHDTLWWLHLCYMSDVMLKWWPISFIPAITCKLHLFECVWCCWIIFIALKQRTLGKI